MSMNFFVYILISEIDGSFYIGQTNDINSRLQRHNSGSEKYTSKKIPWKIFWFTEVNSRSAAMKLERRLKNMKSRKRIMEFIEQHQAGPVA
jgi:putative endonuclease